MRDAQRQVKAFCGGKRLIEARGAQPLDLTVGEMSRSEAETRRTTKNSQSNITVRTSNTNLNNTPIVRELQDNESYEMKSGTSMQVHAYIH